MLVSSPRDRRRSGRGSRPARRRQALRPGRHALDAQPGSSRHPTPLHRTERPVEPVRVARTRPDARPPRETPDVHRASRQTYRRNCLLCAVPPDGGRSAPIFVALEVRRLLAQRVVSGCLVFPRRFVRALQLGDHLHCPPVLHLRQRGACPILHRHCQREGCARRGQVFLAMRTIEDEPKGLA